MKNQKLSFKTITEEVPGSSLLASLMALLADKKNGSVNDTARRKAWLLECTPLHVLVIAGVFVVAAFAVNLYVVSQQPFLGVVLSESAASDHLIVTNVKNPQNNMLKIGDFVAAFVSDERMVVLNRDALLRSPADAASTFSEYNRLLSEQERLYDIYTSPRLSVQLVDGSVVPLTPAADTPLSSLSLRYWLVNLFGALAFIVGVGVWSFRRGEPAIRLLALLGLGYWLSAFFGSMYLFRELVMPVAWLRIADVGNSVGSMLLACSVLSLLWYYPKQLGIPRMALWIYVGMSVVLINEVLQIIDWPLHTFNLQYMVVFFLGIGFAVVQWQQSEKNPVARAALLWFLLSILISTGVIVMLYFLPFIFGSTPLITPAVTYYLLLVFYLGVVLSVVRVQLFKLEEWCIKAWVCYGVGVFVLFVDVVLVYALNLRFLEGLSLAVLCLVWLYFPIRKWCWGRIIVPPQERLEYYLPQFIASFYSTTSVEHFDAKWRDFLVTLFTPLSVRCMQAVSDKPHLADNAFMLRVPAITQNETLLLIGRNQSTRLFSIEDTKMVDSLLAIARQVAAMRQAHEHGVSEERERIKRDLHDDVGAKLLTLIHRAPTPSDGEIARSALCSLRDTIYSLGEQRVFSIDEALADIRVETDERLESAGIDLEWIQSLDNTPGILSHLQSINLVRIMREVVSNILVHAYARRVVVRVGIGQASLEIAVTDDGMSTDTSRWVLGVGTQNITRRVNALGGNARWYRKEPGLAGVSGVTFEMIFPIKQE
ncbi:MAG: hypothetical protein GXP08_04425 [Gammaproteobacteria bacterium]|nr:hypothetical protein [Gammaproteobacteria bacterium]